MADKESPKNLNLSIARKKDLELVMGLIKNYHDYEGIEGSHSSLQAAVYPLLKKANELGCILLIQLNDQTIGYLALCFGYSIEFGGRDAFIDEFFIIEKYRGKKYGTSILEQCANLAKKIGINALHAEAKEGKNATVSLYEKCGFNSRSKYRLMSRELN